VRATKLFRRRVESSDPAPNFDVLLAAVYVPKSNLSETSPFFSLLALRQPATDCKKSLEAMIAHSQDKKDQPEGDVQEFSAAGRDYFRVNLARGVGGRHQCVICTTASGHLLVWRAGAPKEKGLDAICGDPQLDHSFAPAECNDICAIDRAQRGRHGRRTLKSGCSTPTANERCEWGHGGPVD
jgi:hypothetical protein